MVFKEYFFIIEFYLFLFIIIPIVNAVMSSYIVASPPPIEYAYSEELRKVPYTVK